MSLLLAKLHTVYFLKYNSTLADHIPSQEPVCLSFPMNRVSSQQASCSLQIGTRRTVARGRQSPRSNLSRWVRAPALGWPQDLRSHHSKMSQPWASDNMEAKLPRRSHRRALYLLGVSKNVSVLGFHPCLFHLDLAFFFLLSFCLEFSNLPVLSPALYHWRFLLLSLLWNYTFHASLWRDMFNSC